MNKSSVGILGVGAIGSVVSSQLFENPKVELFHYNRSKKKKIKVASPYRKIFYPIDCQTIVFENQKLDWLIICLKEHHFLEAKNWFEKLINHKTKVVIIRNGLNLKEPILPFTEESQILECMIDCPTQLDGNGDYQQFSKPKITSIKNELATNFSSLFNKEEIDFYQVDDFKTAAWKKLIESASLGAILCLKLKTCEVFKNPKILTEYLDLLKEARLVALADGAKIEENFPNELVLKLKSYPPEKGSSMLSDRLAGKRIEIGAKNGVIVEIGKQFGIETPLHLKVVEQLEKIKILRHEEQRTNDG